MTDSFSHLQDLLRLARSGDETALGELLLQHRPLLKLLTQRQLDGLPPIDTEGSDIVQQVSLSAVRAFPGFRGETMGEFVGWLKEIHHHAAVDLLRRHFSEKRGGAQRRLPLDSLVPARQLSASQRLLQDERAGLLAAAVEKLPEDQREAVRLRHLEGWSIQDISVKMGRSEAASAGLVKRGLSALRKLLEE